MVVVAMLDPRVSIPVQVDWALWIARAEKGGLTLLLPKPESDGTLLAKVRARITATEDYAVPDTEIVEAADVQAAAEAGDDDPHVEQRACLLVEVDETTPDAVVTAVGEGRDTLFVVFVEQFDRKDQRNSRIGRDLLPRIPCAAVTVRIGSGESSLPTHILVSASRGSHARDALRLTNRLALAAEARVTAAYVEPEIGDDAKNVGRHVIDKVLQAALENESASAESTAEIGRRVVLGRDPAKGLQEACKDVDAELAILATSRPALLDARFYGSVPAKFADLRKKLPLIVLREPVPVGQPWRRVEHYMRRLVPQIERAERVNLSYRTQSSSDFNFDFAALIGLSTLIAALGLLQDSVAVIIGAMLVAPLMSPILGFGLALAQWNWRLGRDALRTVAMGVVLAWFVALAVGVIHGQPDSGAMITAEMERRGEPGLTDLFVALVSGLAAAYASSRPGLVGAIAGVAIAAALVPPIATSGLACAAGKWALAGLAFVLFLINMLVIALAAGFTMWAVGASTRSLRYPWLLHLCSIAVLAALGWALCELHALRSA